MKYGIAMNVDDTVGRSLSKQKMNKLKKENLCSGDERLFQCAMTADGVRIPAGLICAKNVQEAIEKSIAVGHNSGFLDVQAECL